MKLFEYQSKTILASYGILVPKSVLSSSVEEAVQAVLSLGGKVVVKAKSLSFLYPTKGQ